MNGVDRQSAGLPAVIRPPLQCARRQLFPVFECGDGLFVFEDVAELVEIFEEAGFRERVDGEGHGWTVADGERLGGKIDGRYRIRAQQGVGFAIDDDGKQTILQRILTEDIGKTCRDHGFETEVHQSPHGMFARAAAAEIASGDKNRGAFGDAEIGTIFKQVFSNAGLVRHLQESRRNNLIRVDVLAGHAYDT